MDPKRKKLYLVLMSVCILATVGILLWGRGGTPSVQFDSPTTMPGGAGSPNATPARTTINPDATYPPPPVFPQSQTIDVSVLQSSSFTSLQDFQAAKLTPSELGRENPFKQY